MKNGRPNGTSRFDLGIVDEPLNLNQLRLAARKDRSAAHGVAQKVVFYSTGSIPSCQRLRQSRWLGVNLPES